MLLCHHGNTLPVNCFQTSPRPLDENKLNRNYSQRAKTASFQSPGRVFVLTIWQKRSHSYLEGQYRRRKETLESRRTLQSGASVSYSQPHRPQTGCKNQPCDSGSRTLLTHLLQLFCRLQLCLKPSMLQGIVGLYRLLPFIKAN